MFSDFVVLLVHCPVYAHLIFLLNKKRVKNAILFTDITEVYRMPYAHSGFWLGSFCSIISVLSIVFCKLS